MIKIVASVLVTVTVLSIAAGAALWGGSTAASGEGGPGPVAAPPNLKAGGDVEVKKVSYIGIVVLTLQPDEVEELGIDGGVVVDRVLDDGPATGTLAPGDIIIATDASVDSDGVPVASASDVVKRVRDASPGDVITFRVNRGDDILLLDVEVGEREHRKSAHHFGHPGLGKRLFSHLLGLPGKIVRSETTFETDDGFKTVSVVAGTVSNIDVENGTFTLTPVDGSTPIDYTISDDTLVITRHTGDLGGLNSEDRTTVLAVDGQIKVVAQGVPLRGHGMVWPHSKGPGFSFQGPGHGPGRRFGAFRAMPELRERLQRIAPGFEAVLDDAPLEFRDLLDGLRQDPDDTAGGSPWVENSVLY